MKLVQCPVCKKRRKVSDTYAVRSRGESLACPSCAHIKKPVRSFEVPCGIIIPGTGRCELGEKCRHYDDCLDKTAHAIWRGWRRQPIKQERSYK